MLTVTDFFCGAGGSSQGMHNVPGLRVATAANHWDLAVRTHQENFPDVRHDCADISQIDFRRYPRTDLLWSSPECTNHSVAKGVKRANDLQPDLFGEVLPEEAAVRSRATMWDVPRYLEAMVLRGKPVLGGVVENVVDARNWALFDAWCMTLRALGYDMRIVYLNSMFARARVTPHAPQSRDRMYVVYWRKGDRAPQLEKWLRPDAECSDHGTVQAVQSWKNPDREWGRYRAQYIYRCPMAGCWKPVEPWALPAAAAIDWNAPGQRIGDRAKPLAEKTLARIRAGLAKYAQPLAVPVEGRDGKAALPIDGPMRTMTTRNETGLAWTPFIAELRGGGSDHRPVTDSLATVCASGNHHGLVAGPELAAMVMRNNTPRGDAAQMCTPATEPIRTLTTSGHQSLITWPMLVPAGGTWNDEARPITEPFRARTTRETEGLLVPYYSNGTARPVEDPMATVTTRDRQALVTTQVDVEDCLFRMLAPSEIGRAMAFGADYTVLGNKREQVRQLGNAVTPPAAEVLMSALVEAITGEDIPTGGTR